MAAVTERDGIGGSDPQTAESPIDWALASSLTGGDRALLVELTEMFPPESAKLLAEIRTALVSRDSELLTRSAHTLKGTAKCFGAPDLVACALEVEEFGRASRFDDAERCLERLESESNRLNDALANERAPG